MASLVRLNGGGNTTSDTIEPDVFRFFAEMLEYPQSGLVETALRCEALVGTRNGEAASLLREFMSVLEDTPPAQLQETYTELFDLNPSCYPYVGYHLFGESYRRSAFLVGLKERYQAYGFSPGNELPDHVAVLLRFLALNHDDDLTGELIHEGLLPSLNRMIEGGEKLGQKPGRRDAREAYMHVLMALFLVLQQRDLTETVNEKEHDVNA